MRSGRTDSRAAREQQLDSIRDQAAAQRGDRTPGPAAARRSGDATKATGGTDAFGYYGLPILKPPVWTWEIPTYFFAGGLTGMSAVLAFGALAAGAERGIVHMAMWIAFGGSLVSSGLLISDLGRPKRFLNMLRVFKWRSPMSMGAWLLAAFGAAAAAGAVLAEWRYQAAGDASDLLIALAFVAVGSAAVLGALLATYTAVLIGVTVVPVWRVHRRLLPVHFGAAALGSAAAVLELSGFLTPALAAVGWIAAGTETFLWLWLELRRHGAADRAAYRGQAALLLRTASLLSGPLALAMRAAALPVVAALAFLAGSLLSRFGWLEAGRASARDPEAASS